MTRSTTILGVVSAGRGEAGGFVGLPWVVEQLERAAGFRPFPGTLNLKLRDEASLARWRRIRRVPGFLLEPADPSFCSAAVHPVTLPEGIAAVVVVPHVPSYPEDLVEIIAADRLRDRLGLRDGDEVVVWFSEA
ncbi:MULTISPECIES: DUF120 domain-containing protein [Deferrisoma]